MHFFLEVDMVFNDLVHDMMMGTFILGPAVIVAACCWDEIKDGLARWIKELRRWWRSCVAKEYHRLRILMEREEEEALAAGSVTRTYDKRCAWTYNRADLADWSDARAAMLESMDDVLID